MSTYAIHITGQVQGIGFRPFAYRLARQYGLDGWVSNRPDGVHLTVTGQHQQVQAYYHSLTTQAPALATIQTASIKQVDDAEFDGFQIRKELVETNARLSITPDLAMCADCSKELKDNTNGRYNYAFTTCTACGPRYSIMSGLPYDREHTSMATFVMCAACAQEYNNPEDRRYYSQTNSCPACPILLALYDKQQQLITNDQQESIATAAALLAAGEIIAMKGIGGYLLLADATNPKPIQNLRERKQRPTKPFALMYPSLEVAKQDVELKEDEEKLLFSSATPIVLAHKKHQTMSGVQNELVAPKMSNLGIMLPYAPLFELLLTRFQKPLIATSANNHGSHITYKDNCAFRLLASLADIILLHNREILVPQDDSVLQLTPKHRQRIMLRRARGYAPSVFSGVPEKQSWLALGADLKSTFAFSHQGNTYVSQYLGDLADY
ncbi:MAG: Sua5/YciO/YrdC/YwlC family protein, partial [Hymenobacteraceae bacterium]|nr:Sua5/YciO/YrdC/YwlC family protein [Hymenobacteraceae bacterium]